MYVPQRIVSNKELEKTLETSDKWIFERTGIRERRMSSSEGGEFPSDMALYATREALKRAKIRPEEIDIILFATLTPDYRVPITASVLQDKLGLRNHCACLDINAACSGFVYGFNMAHAMIQVGMIRKALVVGSELLTQEVDQRERTVSILFGDGCGVAILGGHQAQGQEEGQGPPVPQILSTYFGADGREGDLFSHKTGGAAKPITHEILETRQNFMSMKGKEIFKVATRTLAENAKKVVARARVALEDVTWMIPHQANLRIIETAAKILNFPQEKVICNVDKYGNTSAATIPIAFHEAIADGRIQRGDLVLFNAFGAGLTFGATLFRY